MFADNIMCFPGKNGDSHISVVQLETSRVVHGTFKTLSIITSDEMDIGVMYLISFGVFFGGSDSPGKFQI